MSYLTAHFTEEPVKLDGVLDEDVWLDAEAKKGFTQREPDEGEPATEVLVLYDEENLYIGVICHETISEHIVHNEMRFDCDLSSDDNISIVIDTFNDNRGAFFLQ